ncbi:kinase phosphorylation protein-domain-containing protein [Mycena capillaripes]|nr:kinase phosphorylation protein-domain-containing protein [Mycena capillaripes]
MAMMFEPIRGGTRGGQAEFKWSDVSADKDRENYLGHSINAPTGRWQKNKDVHWYNRDVKQTDDERAEEIRKIKEAEADALAVALGFEPAPKTAGAPAASSSGGSPKAAAEDPNIAVLEKAERRRKKAERKEEKRAKKAQRRLERGEPDYDDRRDRDRSRSHSPVRRRTSPRPERRRSPPRRSRSPPRPDVDYAAEDRERERERDRRRWDANARREQPGSAEWGRR